MDLCVSENTVCMATTTVPRLAPATARDGVDTRPQGEKDNSVMPAGGSGETTCLEARSQDRDAQTAANMTLVDGWKMWITSCGFDPELWVRKLDAWDVPDESDEDPHPEQHAAALELFAWMFTVKCAWAHLAAEMQAGKSGVANALIRLCMQNANILGINPKTSMFVLTGMSDDAWKKQTRARVPKAVRDNVHHSGGLNKVKVQLTTLAAKDGLRNVLIILDESQVASNSSNRPNSLIYKTVRDLVPVEQWVERNIRFLTISATDPAKVMAMESCEASCFNVQLKTSEDYQSVESLHAAGRIRSLEDHGDIGSGDSVAELKRAVGAYSTPLWHILRPKTGKGAEVEEKLRKAFPGAQVISWDSSKRSAPESDGDDSSSETSGSLADINDLLANPPATHSFVLLKNMFYAAKTLNDKHVGVLWDRLGGNVGGDNARLQSLLGRACGYGKSQRTVVYTSTETVNRYLSFWKELCRTISATKTTSEFRAVDLHYRMPGVVAVSAAGGSARVAPLLGVSNPTAETAANAIAPTAGKVEVNQDNYAVEWKEFKTFADVKAYAPRVQEPKTDEEDFYLSSTTSKLKRLSYGDVKSLLGGKKTAGFDVRDMKVGGVRSTMYVCYRDLHDRNSVVFVVGRLTRTA